MTLEKFKDDANWQDAFSEAYYGRYILPDKRAGRGPIEDVKRVIACDEGEYDGDNWLAIVEWSGPEGPYAVMEAGCDYTGWD